MSNTPDAPIVALVTRLHADTTLAQRVHRLRGVRQAIGQATKRVKPVVADKDETRTTEHETTPL